VLPLESAVSAYSPLSPQRNKKIVFVTGEDGLPACRFSIGSLRECVISLHKPILVTGPTVTIGREDVAAVIAAVIGREVAKSVKPKTIAKPSAEIPTGKTSATKMIAEPATKMMAEPTAKMAAETAAAKMTAPTAAAKMTAPAAAARERTGGGRYGRCAQRQ
jgi:hypothetical protein